MCIMITVALVFALAGPGVVLALLCGEPVLVAALACVSFVGFGQLALER